MHNEDDKNECNNIELRRCPFCGGKAKLGTWKNTEYSEHSDHSDCYQVFCAECFVETSDESDEMEFSLSKERCIADWNRRTPAAPQWTTEPPQEEGWYMVWYGKKHTDCIEIVTDQRQYDSFRLGVYVEPTSLCETGMQFFSIEDYAVRYAVIGWCKINFTPLPGKESNE